MEITDRRLASVKSPQTVDCSTNSKRDYRVFFMYCAPVDREQTEQIMPTLQSLLGLNAIISISLSKSLRNCVHLSAD